MTVTFDTVTDIIAGPPSPRIVTGLPQLDRVAPIAGGQLVVLIGTSGVGKSVVAEHIAGTVQCTHHDGSRVVTQPTTLEDLDSDLTTVKPGVLVIDPLISLLAPRHAAAGYNPAYDTSSVTASGMAAYDDGSDELPVDTDPANADVEPDTGEQHPVHPAVLGELAHDLRTLARRHQVPILACHRYAPIRDSVTGKIASTESVNPLLDLANLVIVVRVLADPSAIGLEIIRNDFGPTMMLRMPVAAMKRGC